MGADELQLYTRVAEIIEAARAQVTRSVNTAMVHAYWLIGREIVEEEQLGEDRAQYGEQVIKQLATRLTSEFGRGFSLASVKRIKQFYISYPDGSAIPEQVGNYQKGSALLSLSAGPEKSSALLSLSAPEPFILFPPLLSWTHYLTLMRVADPQARAFYEIEAASEHWSTRELERQMGSLLYERLAKSRNKEEILLLAKSGQQVEKARDVLKDPLILDFLELEERSHWLERDLEQAIIDGLESFLLELGKGFCFVGRQKRLTIDGDHFYVDLVFYNRLLSCFVLIDLKLGKLTHHDIGQMQMYVNYFDRHQRIEHESDTVGIILCSDKNDAMVKISLPESGSQIHASQYQLFLPTEAELCTKLEKEREQAERVLSLQDQEVVRGS